MTLRLLKTTGTVLARVVILLLEHLRRHSTEEETPCGVLNAISLTSALCFSGRADRLAADISSDDDIDKEERGFLLLKAGRRRHSFTENLGWFHRRLTQLARLDSKAGDLLRSYISMVTSHIHCGMIVSDLEHEEPMTSAAVKCSPFTVKDLQYRFLNICINVMEAESHI